MSMGFNGRSLYSDKEHSLKQCQYLRAYTLTNTSFHIHSLKKRLNKYYKNSKHENIINGIGVLESIKNT
jgi:hypothetical protein